MKRPLTDLTLRKITPQRGTRVEIWDTHLPGFGMRMSETGVKTFVVMYRTGGVKRRLTLGRWPILPLAEAREKARDALKTAALGTDPQAQKRVAKEEQSGYRFSEVVRSFITLHCEQRNRPVTKRDTERILKNRFVGPLGKRDIREIRKADVLKILDGILAAGTPSAANHALAAVRKLFSWCIERGLVEHSPCAGIKKPARDNSRERVLRDEELLAIWQAADKVGYPFGTIVKILILTGQRRSEVGSMRWSGIKLEQNPPDVDQAL